MRAAILTYFPLFHALTRYANPAMYAAQSTAPVTVTADPRQCSFQFDPIGKNTFDSTSCDIAKSFLAKAGVSYQRIEDRRPAGNGGDDPPGRQDIDRAGSAGGRRQGAAGGDRRLPEGNEDGPVRGGLSGQGRPGGHQ